MVHSSTLKMESVHITLTYRYSFLAHTVSLTRTPLSIFDVTHWKYLTDRHFFIPPCRHLRCFEPVYCSIYVTLCCVLWAPGCWTQWKESNWLWYSFVLCIMERESKYVYHQLFYWNGSFMIIALLYFYAMYFLQICRETWKKVGAEDSASPFVQGMMQRCHLRRMGKWEFRVAWKERAYIARDKYFRYNLEGKNHKEIAQRFLWWTQTVDYF